MHLPATRGCEPPDLRPSRSAHSGHNRVSHVIPVGTLKSLLRAHIAAHDTHHFVPAFLLRRWEGGTDKKLSAFRWVNDKLVHARYKAKSVAKTAGLYSLSDAKGIRDNVVEREFFTREIDDPAALVHRRMIIAGLSALTQEERVIWGRFVVAQMMRVPRMMYSLKAKGAKALQASLAENPNEYDAVKEDSDPSTLTEWVARNMPITSGDNFALVALPSIVESELLHDVIRRAHWGTIEPKNTPHDFLIGDHPLLYVGTMNTVFLIALPISPKIAFVAFNKEETAQRIRRLSGRDLVEGMNLTTTQTAEHHVYATDTNNEAFIARHLPRP